MPARRRGVTALRDRALLTALGASVALSAAMALANGRRSAALAHLRSPDAAETARTLSETAIAETALAATAASIVLAAVLLLLWLRRCWAHFADLGAPMGYRRWQLIAAWLVPVVNLVWPYRIMRELLEALADTRGLSEEDEHALKRLLKGWWGFALVGLVGAPLFALAGSAPRPEGAYLAALITARGLAFAGAALAVSGVLLELLLMRLMALLAKSPQRHPAPEAVKRYEKSVSSLS